LFGIGHLYQGLAGVVKTGLVGMVLGWIYSLSGSIWIPMFIHAAADVLQGRMIYFATASGGADEAASSAV
jgi:membrane protease YdiL (CAAX protease family)